MGTERRTARILAMQLLCQWDVQQDSSKERLAECMAAQEVSNRAAEYARALVETYWDRREEVDRAISVSAKHWSLERISIVERNTIRVAIVELLKAEVPSKVVLNEAIEIGNEFGGADSGRFINGVLDEVWQTFIL